MSNQNLIEPKIKPKRKNAAGAGRPKGSANKTTKAIKDMILIALSNAGGEDYLTRQADENPVAFMGLLGKILPQEAKLHHSGEIGINKIQIEFIDT